MSEREQARSLIEEARQHSRMIHDLADALKAALDWEKRLRDCDCVPVMVSSKACRKCGRRGIQSQEWLLALVEEVQEFRAALSSPAEPDREQAG